MNIEEMKTRWIKCFGTRFFAFIPPESVHILMAGFLAGCDIHMESAEAKEFESWVMKWYKE